MQGEVIPQRRFFDRIKRSLASIGAGLVALIKLLPSLKLLVFLKTGGSMLITMFYYAWATHMGWPFAAGLVLLIFVHEMGHLIAARMMGLKVSAPIFIPFFGAMILMKEMPRNAWVEAVVGIGGPVLGSLGSLVVWTMYFVTGNPFFLVLGYFGFFINLFNLIPIVPLDGGRIVAAVSPWFWLLGLPMLVAVLFLYSTNILLMIVLALLIVNSLPRVIALFRKRTDVEQRYFECTPLQRWTMAFSYLALLGGLGGLMYYTEQLTGMRL